MYNVDHTCDGWTKSLTPSYSICLEYNRYNWSRTGYFGGMYEVNIKLLACLFYVNTSVNKRIRR